MGNKMKILILCLLIGSIAAINQSNMDFQEVATSRASSGCIDRLHQVIQVHQDCKKLDLSCPRLKSTQKSKIWQNWLKSQCNKTLKQKVGDDKEDKKCLKRIKKKDANRKIYEFCAGSCQKCKPKATPAPKSTPEPKATPAPKSTPEPKPTLAPTSGVSLKEYQKQLDIFKKSIDAQHRDMGKLKALLDKVQGDLQHETKSKDHSVTTILGEINKLNNTVVKRCQQDTDCGQSLICVDEWCVLPVQCRSNGDCGSGACDTVSGRCYQYEKNTYCSGGKVEGTVKDANNVLVKRPYWTTLGDAVSACRSNQECGCIKLTGCDRKNYHWTFEGTSTRQSGLYISGTNSCSWVKN